jgi:hypothetical protein
LEDSRIQGFSPFSGLRLTTKTTGSQRTANDPANGRVTTQLTTSKIIRTKERIRTEEQKRFLASQKLSLSIPLNEDI